MLAEALGQRCEIFRPQTCKACMVLAGVQCQQYAISRLQACLVLAGALGHSCDISRLIVMLFSPAYR